MVNNERLLLNPNDQTQWFFEVNQQQQLMYALANDHHWLPLKSTGISGVTAYEICLTDDSTPCLVCLEQQGRLSCIVYNDNQWHYYPTAAIPQETTVEFLNIFCTNDLLYVYSGFRRSDSKLYTFCASRSNDTWTTFKPSSDLYNKKGRILSTLPYKKGIVLAMQQTNDESALALSFIYMTENEFTPLYNPFICQNPIQTLSLFYQPNSNDLCALWAEDCRCCSVKNGHLIHDRTLSNPPEELFCDIYGKYYVQFNREIYHLEHNLSVKTRVDDAYQMPVRQVISHNGSVSHYIGLDSPTAYYQPAPLSGVASVSIAPSLSNANLSPTIKKKKPVKGINTMSETSSLEERIITLEKKYSRLEKIASALSEQVKHFRAALLQTEDYMQQRDKALYRLESAIGHPLTPKSTTSHSQNNKTTTNNFSSPFEDKKNSSIPKSDSKDGQNLYSGMDGLYIIKNKSNKSNK